MGSYVIPDPRNLAWQLWAQQLILLNPGNLPTQVDARQDWKAFANKFTLIEPRVPRATFFEDWQGWASALRLALSA